MLAHAPSIQQPVVVPNRPVDAVDVLPLLRRIRRALDAALLVPRLPSLDEQRFSGVYVGLVDLERRLREVARLCGTIDTAGLQVTRADLLARTTTAVELLEVLTALHCLAPSTADAMSQACIHTRRVVALERTYGRALFA
jgi:hypothetical protein